MIFAPTPKRTYRAVDENDVNVVPKSIPFVERSFVRYVGALHDDGSSGLSNSGPQTRGACRDALGLTRAVTTVKFVTRRDAPHTRPRAVTADRGGRQSGRDGARRARGSGYRPAAGEAGVTGAAAFPMNGSGVFGVRYVGRCPSHL